MTTEQRPGTAVLESFAEAQQRAAAMAGKPPLWAGGATARRGVRSRRWGVFTVLAVAAGAAAWWALDGATESAASAPSSGPARAPGAQLLTQAPATGSTPAAAPAYRDTVPAGSTAPSTATAATSLDVTRTAGVVRIKAVNASLLDAVRALAQATQSSVRGAEALAPLTGPVTLAWQGQDTAAAWDALLGRYASTAVSCNGSSCAVWIVGVNAAPKAPGLAAASAMPAVPGAVQPLAPGQDMHLQAAPQPNSEEATETN